LAFYRTNTASKSRRERPAAWLAALDRRVSLAEDPSLLVSKSSNSLILIGLSTVSLLAAGELVGLAVRAAVGGLDRAGKIFVGKAVAVTGVVLVGTTDGASGGSSATHIGNVKHGTTILLKGGLSFNRNTKTVHPDVHEIFRASLVEKAVEFDILDVKVI
jgi:hypothetical protein